MSVARFALGISVGLGPPVCLGWDAALFGRAAATRQTGAARAGLAAARRHSFA